MGETSKVIAPTVNSKEMSHYKFLSASWWNKEDSMDILHVLNDLRIPWIINTLVETRLITKDAAESFKPLQGLSALDVGCGGGFATEALADLGCTTVGIDPSPELIHVAKIHLKEKPDLSKNITYICGSIEEHSEQNYEKYDVIVVSEVIEHVDQQDLFVEVCVKCLKPGGLIFITTFNKTWTSWLIGIILFEYVLARVPRGHHSWYKFTSPADIKRLLAKYNCKTKDVRGMYYNPFLHKWSWSYFTSVSYALHAVKNKK